MNNLAMNYLVLRMTRRLVNRKSAWWRCLAACVLGAVYAVLILYKVWQPLDTLPLKALLSLGMVALAFRQDSVLGYVKRYAVFMGATFLLGGAMLGIFFLSGNGIWHMGAAVITTFPVHLLLIVSVCVLTGIDLFMLNLRKRVQVENHAAAVELTLWNQTILLSALVDSGNMLLSGGQRQVVIVSYTALKAMAPEALRKHFEQPADDAWALEELLESVSGTMLLPYQTIGKAGIMVGVKPSRLRVRKDADWIEPMDTCIAIMPGKLGEDIQALIPPALFA